MLRYYQYQQGHRVAEERKANAGGRSSCVPALVAGPYYVAGCQGCRSALELVRQMFCTRRRVVNVLHNKNSGRMELIVFWINPMV